jgi:hypothetical protein
MNAYNLKHLSGADLLARTAILNRLDRVTTTRLLAHLGEIDDRKEYAGEGHPSMFAYCVHGLGMSDDSAAKRIQVARVTHKHHALYPALADRRLHMAAVRLLAPYLVPANVDDLISAASHKTCDEIRDLLARRFPQAESLVFPEVIPPVRPVPVVPSQPVQGIEHAPGHVRGTVKPLSPQRFDLHVVFGAGANDDLKRARELSGLGVEDVLTRALALYVADLEKKQHAATNRPLASPRPSSAARTIPAAVKRFVWRRDRGTCTFRGPEGRRCTARTYLEYDHVIPLTLGGRATVENIRLLCRTHNQLEAERRLGKDWMDGRRAQASRKPPKSSHVPAPVSRAFS